jgi:hypothetical protein
VPFSLDQGIAALDLVLEDDDDVVVVVVVVVPAAGVIGPRRGAVNPVPEEEAGD